MTDLEKARQTINEVDKQMANLFERRMDAVKLVAEYKRKNGLQIEDAQREKQVIERNLSLISNEAYRSYFTSFIVNNMEIAKKMQHKMLEGMSVAFNGVPGAFADIVARRIFKGCNTIPYNDFKSAYKSVENGECDCVLLPIENSFNGDVGKVMDLAFFGDLYITGIYEAEIVQNLLGIPGATLSDIKTVISHPQALGQCASYIEEHGFKQVESVSTATAAKEVAERQQKDIAAIASIEAAENFGLVKLEGHINESSTNTTRFAVFSRSQKLPDIKDKHFILLFTVKNTAGSLGKAISVIGEHGFNLLALKSRPTKELIWDYYFYAEGEGSLETEEGHKMLSDLAVHCNNLRVIGSFEKEIRI